MKNRWPWLGAVALAIGLFGCASQQNTSDVASEPNAREHYRNVTGSYLPQDVERSGPVTNGRNDLRIIDRSDLERGGGADVNQSLRQLGVGQ